jgi:type I restriction enzyme S subunit
MIKLDSNKYIKCKFGDMAFNISERVDPGGTDLGIYVGLEHLDPECIHIKRKGVPSDVKGIKLRVYPGDIIFGKRRAYQRKAGLVDFNGICSAHAMVVRANQKVILPELFPFFIHSDLFMHRAVDISEGSLSPTIKWKIISKEEFKLPPLDKQKRLADLLWSVDKVIEKYNIVFSALDCLCKSYAFQEFSGNINNYIFLKEIIKLFKGKQPIKLYSENKEGRLPYLTTDHIRNGNSQFVDVNFVDENNLASNKDILILWDGSNAGETFFGYRGVVVSTTAKIKITSNKVLTKYLHSFLKLNKDVIKRARIGSAIPHVSADFLLNLKFPLKKLDEQKKFINQISYFENQKNIVNSSSQILLKAQKQIINQIFGGKS